LQESKLQTTHKVLDLHQVMLGDALEDRMQRADANRIVIGDNFVVLAANLRCHTKVRAFLTRDDVTEPLQCFD
jgi:hypothetical protein